MGFLGEFRKLLFGVKSVSKSGAKKAADKGKEIGEDILETGEELYHTGREKARDLGDKIGDKWDDIKEDTAEFTKGVKDSVSKNPTVQKTADFTEKVGKEVLDKGGKAMEKAGELSEKVGEKVIQAKDKFMEKAEEVGGKLKDKYDETYEKAKKLEEEEALEGDSEFADTPLDAGGSFIEDKDDFFSRADKFSKGDYHGDKKEVKKEEKPLELPADDAKIIRTDGDTTISLPAAEPKKKDPAKAAGFDDLDGDGNEVVDDAIIDEEE